MNGLLIYLQNLCGPTSSVSPMNTFHPFNYKFVIDNIDKNVKPSFQHSEIKGRSYHHLQGYSVQGRIDTSWLSDCVPPLRIADASVMLPAQSEISVLKDEMVI